MNKKMLSSMLLDFATLVEELEQFTPEGMLIWLSDAMLNILPDAGSDEQKYRLARLVVGNIQKNFGVKPTFQKGWGTMVMADFYIRGLHVRVYNYRGANCKIEVEKIRHEAQPEQIIPAKDEWIEEREMLVCS
jgi:hypothetical protein